MRSKAPLALLEQLVMILVFALAAALCLQAFALADRISRENEARDRAVLQVQNAAELLKGCAGDYESAAELGGGKWDGQQWLCLYDENWQPVQEQEVYYICAAPVERREPLLGMADVAAFSVDGECLYQVFVAWQKEEAHE